MSRPTDWYVVDLGGDPTPGEAWGVRTLAREYGEIAASARSASTVLTRVQSSGSSAVWVGEAAEVFREKLEDFPENIAKCAASFEIVRDAMYSWASSVESWQSQADTNLNKARLARADIEAAQAALVAAQDAAASVQGEVDRAMRTVNQYQYVEPPASIKVPSAYQISQLRYRATGASSSTTSASGTVQEAQDRFDAAKALVLAAAEEFAAAAKTVVGTIEAAEDAGMEADSWWEKIYHSDAWQVIVKIATVVVIVAAIAAFFVTGPLAIILTATAFVAGAVLTAGDIASVAAGEMPPGELMMAMVLVAIPGGRALKSLDNVADAMGAAARRGDDAADAVTTVSRRADDGADLSTAAARKADDVAPPPAPQVREVLLRPKKGWSEDQLAAFHKKIDQLNASDPVKTRVAMAARLVNVRRLYLRAGHSIERNFDIDHIKDLQLGGTNALSNLQQLDRSVNRSVGSQIRWRTVGDEYGISYVFKSE